MQIRSLTPEEISKAYKENEQLVRAAIMEVLPSLDYEDLDDLAQDAWVRIWEKRDTFDPTKAALTTWMYEVATSVAKNYIRDSIERQPDTTPESRLVPEEEEDEESWMERNCVDECDPGQVVQDEEVHRQKVDSLSSLEFGVADAVLVRGVSVGQVADAFDVQPTTVRTVLQRVKNKLS